MIKLKSHSPHDIIPTLVDSGGPWMNQKKIKEFAFVFGGYTPLL